jgi:hypothetical protein
MDMVRFDFFCRKGDPDAIAINENSISSVTLPSALALTLTLPP